MQPGAKGSAAPGGQVLSGGAPALWWPTARAGESPTHLDCFLFRDVSSCFKEMQPYHFMSIHVELVILLGNGNVFSSSVDEGGCCDCEDGGQGKGAVDGAGLDLL